MSALQGALLALSRRAKAMPRRHAPALARTTTILAVRKGESVVVVGDGQVTLGSSVVKNNARKVRRLGPNDRVVAGFAGATADALSLFDRLETKLEEHPEQLLRACVSLAKDWRTDKYLRRLDAMLLVCDREHSLYVTGAGDVLQPSDGVIGIGSGGTLAVAAARALVPIDGMGAKEIATKAMDIAADLCIYTNSNFVVETVLTPAEDPPAGGGGGGGNGASSVSSEESEDVEGPPDSSPEVPPVKGDSTLPPASKAARKPPSVPPPGRSPPGR